MAGAGALVGRCAVVTGAARGIGKAIAAKLAGEGAAVALVDIDGDLATATAGELVRAGHEAVGLAVDVANEAALAGLAEAVTQRWGKLDILVNNAAILDATPLAELTSERFRLVQSINQNSVLFVTMALLPALRRSDAARVVNIASIQGVRATPDTVAYASAKGGVVNMTRALAVDLAPENILVNCIAPGFVDTRMALLPDGSGHEHDTDWFKDIYIKYGRIPLRRAAQPEDIAAATSFFCGSDCRYVTGQILLVDGGVSATF